PPRTSGLQSGCERIPWAPESAADGQASAGLLRPAEAWWAAGAVCAVVSAGSLCKVGPRCRAVPTRREYISVGSRFSSDRRRSCADAIALPPAPADRGSAEAARQVTERRPLPHAGEDFRYNSSFFLTGLVTMEINPILNTIKDLRGRSETIRGYL